MTVVVGPFELDSRVAIDLARHVLGEIDEYVWHPFEIAYRHRDVLRCSEVRRPGGAGCDAEPDGDERHSKTGHWTGPSSGITRRAREGYREVGSRGRLRRMLLEFDERSVLDTDAERMDVI